MGYNVLAKPQLCDEFCERDVIAACLMYTNLFDGLTADLFHTPLCHNIFDISTQIIAAGNKPDIVSVAEFSSKHTGNPPAARGHGGGNQKKCRAPRTCAVAPGFVFASPLFAGGRSADRRKRWAN